MDKIGSLVSKRLNQHKLGEAARASMVLNKANIFLQNKFPNAEGEVSAYRLKNGILFIGVMSSVWSQELWGYKERLIEEIHNEYGKNSVIKVVIKSLTSK